MNHRIAVLASGFGSNLQALMNAIDAGRLSAQIVAVLSDRSEAQALERARGRGIDAIWVNPKNFASRADFDAKITEILRGHDIQLVVLAGFMRILSVDFVRHWQGKLINIHPSLLPKYPGLNALERALEAGDVETGVTVHYVDEGVDTGPIILQEVVPIEPGDTITELRKRVHACEHRLYPQAVRIVLERLQ